MCGEDYGKEVLKGILGPYHGRSLMLRPGSLFFRQWGHTECP